MIKATVDSRPHLDRQKQRGDLAADGLEDLQRIIEHATHLLPCQGPIGVFIHHNTLHAFEDFPFDDAVRKAAKLFGCQPFLTEDRYRAELARGRIRLSDIEAVLRDELAACGDELIAGLGTRLEIRKAMLEFPLRSGTEAELRWFVAETDALQKIRNDIPTAARDKFLGKSRHWIMRDMRSSAAAPSEPTHSPLLEPLRGRLQDLFDRFGFSSVEHWNEATWTAFTLNILWRICRHGVSEAMQNHQPARTPPIRHRDVLLSETGYDTDLLVHPILIRFTAAFLDQGFSTWELPGRENGFLQAFCEVYREAAPHELWRNGWKAEINRIRTSGMTALESIAESLELLGVPPSEREAFITATFLALRGWAGMLYQIETRPDRAVRAIPPGSIIDFLAVRLILDRLALGHVAKKALNYRGPLRELRREVRKAHTASDPGDHPDQIAFQVFQLAQALSWDLGKLGTLDRKDWTSLVHEFAAFGRFERRSILHRAYERKYRIKTLDAIATKVADGERQVDSPRFQAIFCLDEREESMRRHLEEIAPDAETLSTAGFFSAAIYYRGAADAHFVPLCPVVVRPRHWIVEHVALPFEGVHHRRTRTRQTIGAASHQFHVGSRTFFGGAILATAFGALSTIPLVARVLFPRLAARIRRTAGRFVQPPAITKLQIERTAPNPGPSAEEIGFSVQEMAEIVERVLRDTGLTKNFARLVLICGHGSSSLNNPHESAHDCGACGGGRGGPNARAFAQMANDPRVRNLIFERGLPIPPSTVFIGAYHNTCDDSIAYYDLDRLPPSHQEDFKRAKRDMDQARERDAHERCRRFESAPLGLAQRPALRHVEGRSEDLAQTRPEYGHATNAINFVGRRSRTRGLYMDRRAFLTSYDPTQDDESGSILMRILQAVIPVCAGISLEYYFSYVDPTGWGCGTKLPHNLTSLLGVMDGAASDLRPGLPWQMVEIHEPVRILFIIESTPQVMLGIMAKNEAIRRLIENSWVQVATLDPHSTAIHVFTDGEFIPYSPEETSLPRVASSQDWYRGWRDHLGYAVIDSQGTPHNSNGEST